MAAFIRWHKYFKIISDPWRCVVCQWCWTLAFVAADSVFLPTQAAWECGLCLSSECNFTLPLWGLFVLEVRLVWFRRNNVSQRRERSGSLRVILKNPNLLFLCIIGSRFDYHGDTVKTELMCVHGGIISKSSTI